MDNTEHRMTREEFYELSKWFCFDGKDTLNTQDYSDPFDGVNLSWLDLSGLNLDYTNLFGANFVGTDFTGASLRHADLRFSSLAQADLRGVNLEEADLRWVNLDSAVGIMRFYVPEMCTRKRHEELFIVQHADTLMVRYYYMWAPITTVLEIEELDALIELFLKTAIEAAKMLLWEYGDSGNG